MKKKILLAATVVLAGAVQAQTSLDLVSRAQLRQQRLMTAQETRGGKQLKVKGVTPEQSTHVFGMIKLADGCTAEQLEAEGVNVMRCSQGFAFVSGAAVKWLRDELCIIRTAAETEELARSVEDAGGVYFVPAFVGLGAPYWKPEARGMITGLTRGTNRCHIVRATLEAMCYQTYDVLRAMEEDAGAIGSIKADGGAASNDFLMEFQADILGHSVIRPYNVESTATGAAYLAGLGCGLWGSMEELVGVSDKFREFIPSMSESKRSDLIGGWKKAVQAAIEK